ncbi:Mu-like prophage major head subunit gpT family protein [Labrenzia sp. R4_2]|uniref:prohead protease/major capsid protein fusion protein n=1 Tax=Labrenzia sp. R4_2 TaxID=2821107 RepID=UPI001ADADD54|nr:prohead protease/major capsid protein fusion protein [Labrenzia sp. R4_2]MBO9422327.1 Mu-like prophage major head subunit gpT family protein [Labrenzia sp. R4_2]
MNAPLYIRAGFTPTSIVEKDRTVEMVASTGSAVERVDIGGGPFLEVLEISEQAIDLSRLDGMPLLNNHRQVSLDDVLGVVRAARVESGKLIIKVQVSPQRDDIWQGICAGVFRNISVGYDPKKWRTSKDPITGARIKTAISWELREVSIVPVGADPAAQIRGNGMSGTTTTPAPAGPEAPPATTPPQASPQIETRAVVNTEIRALATEFNLGDEWANGQIDRGASEQDARSAAIDALKERRTRPSPILTARSSNMVHLDDPATIVTRMGEAVYFTRVNPSHKLSEAARAYVNMTTLDIARDCLQRAGVSTTGLDQNTIITRALHTTSDFAAIFADTANRALRAAYQVAPATLKRLARQTTHKDFRAKTKVQAADLAKLEKVNEQGEYKYSGFVEAMETYAIGTYGTILALSRKALINDDLGAFNDLSGKLGLASAEFEAQFLVDLLVKAAGLGPTMDDEKPVFHADHGNLAGTGGAISKETLSAARLAMRRQKGINGRPIAIAPKFLVVPPELETQAEEVLAAIQPTRTEDVNVFGGKLDLVVESRLEDPNRWYVAADPATVEGLEYAYLQGSEGPQTDSRAGFEVDGVEVKIRLDFGASFLDWRGWYMNPGA